ncbi:50S ribosomal protein L22 [Rickettsiales endosymbiont of Peranema trichophorum]|uniref:50S ribosomal protein L22 n=1 Tax=Rickettsiales endosymbiont of Peranema trichophorum TaxID=2486577 RepID=UPI0010235520|nr:50S ribosomal protein L22 [Rickettsiales endosymbiont of Peranema trichophorum]RZI45580.1 50S ribosomal protein L22 [Rickettsiales endosymbiont of Peranema trichophorum]
MHLEQDRTAFAVAKAIKGSPQKLGLVADLIRRMPVGDAMLQLQFSKKRVARVVRDVLNSAVANAQNNHNLDIDKLYISEVLVGKAFVLKRMNARARGRAARIQKPFSKLAVFVTERGA